MVRSFAASVARGRAVGAGQLLAAPAQIADARAGEPIISANGCTSAVTNAPAAIMAYRPMPHSWQDGRIRPDRRPAQRPSAAASVRGWHNDGLPVASAASAGCRSFVNVAFGPTNTSSSSVTPVQMQTLFLIVTLFPIIAPDSKKRGRPHCNCCRSAPPATRGRMPRYACRDRCLPTRPTRQDGKNVRSYQCAASHNLQWRLHGLAIGGRLARFAEIGKSVRSTRVRRCGGAIGRPLR